MSEQMALFTAPAARRTDPETSFDAAKAAARRASVLEDNIVAAFEKYGPMNDDELCERLGQWYAPTVKTARSRVYLRGLCFDCGVRRPSERGRIQVVWHLRHQIPEGTPYG